MTARTSAPPAPSAAGTTGSVEARLDRAFRVLRDHGIAGVPSYGADATTAATTIRARLLASWPHGTGWYAFYTAADASRCMDGEGNLLAPLPIHHHPAAGRAVTAALAQVGIAATIAGEHLVVTAARPRHAGRAGMPS